MKRECTKRKYVNEDAAERAIWVMQQKQANEVKLAVGWCNVCRAYHLVKAK